MDVKSTYLHSNIEEVVYLEQPEAFVKKTSSGQKPMSKLNKSIYGLKQVAKNWYKAPTSLLLKKGCKRTRDDYCLIVFGTFSLTIRLRARDFYAVIVDEGEARINYHRIEIESE